MNVLDPTLSRSIPYPPDRGGRKHSDTGSLGSIFLGTLLLLSLLLPVSSGWAQDVAATQARLQQLRAQLETQRSERDRLAQQLNDLRQSLREVQQRPSPEQDELARAREALQQARAAYENEPSEVNASKVKNAEFKLALSERRFAKSNREAQQLQERIENTQAALKAQRQAIDSTDTALARQQRQVSALQRQRAAEERALRERREQELVRQREEAEEAQKEIERLRALLEAREVEAQRDAEEPPVEAPPVPEETDTAPAEASPLLTERSEVMQALQAMQARLDDLSSRDAPTNRILHIKRAGASDPYKLKALGNSQYRAEAELTAGPCELVVGFHRWQVDVPKDGDYIFLYDASQPQQPELLFYPTRLQN